MLLLREFAHHTDEVRFSFKADARQASFLTTLPRVSPCEVFQLTRSPGLSFEAISSAIAREVRAQGKAAQADNLTSAPAIVSKGKHNRFDSVQRLSHAGCRGQRKGIVRVDRA